MLLLAGVLLVTALNADALATFGGALAGMGLPARRLDEALILVGCGLICLGLTALVRIGRLERAWGRYQQALAPVAAERGVEVVFDFPEGLWITISVEGVPAAVDLRLSPQTDPRVDVVCPAALRFPVVVLPAALALRMGPQWSPVAAGPGWRAWSSSAERTWRLGQDERLAAELTTFFGLPGARSVRLNAEGLDVRAALPPMERVGEISRSALGVAEALYRATADLRGG